MLGLTKCFVWEPDASSTRSSMSNNLIVNLISSSQKQHEQHEKLGAIDRRLEALNSLRFDFMYLPIDFKNKCNVGCLPFTEPPLVPVDPRTRPPVSSRTTGWIPELDATGFASKSSIAKAFRYRLYLFSQVPFGNWLRKARARLLSGTACLVGAGVVGKLCPDVWAMNGLITLYYLWSPVSSQNKWIVAVFT